MIEWNTQSIRDILNAEASHGDADFRGVSTDTRSLDPGNLYVALRGERFDGHDFIQNAIDKGAAAVLIDRDSECAAPCLRVTDSRVALADLARAWRQQFTLPVVAVTGSNGKTTVKEMLRSIFAQADTPVLATQGNLNNDIGVPLTLFNLDAAHTHAVIEMGANHVGEIALLTDIARPDVATITQCAPAHLEGFESIEGVAQAKGEIFSGLSQRGIAVINDDDVFAPYWRGLIDTQQHTIFGFALDTETDFQAYSIGLDISANPVQVFDMSTPVGEITISLPLLGRHNVRNAIAAAACAVAAGFDLEQIQRGLAALEAVPGRLFMHNGRWRVIDDSYNANPGSFRAAIEVLAKFPAPRALVMGDMFEMGDDSERFHREIGQAAKPAWKTFMLWAPPANIAWPALAQAGNILPVMTRYSRR